MWPCWAQRCVGVGGFDIFSVMPFNKHKSHKWLCVFTSLKSTWLGYFLADLTLGLINIPHASYLHPDHSWPMPPGVPRWRQTTRASCCPARGSWRCEPSCRPFVSCFASPSRTPPISSAVGCAASGRPAASPGLAPCPAAAAPGSAPGGWPWSPNGRTAKTDDGGGGRGDGRRGWRGS